MITPTLDSLRIFLHILAAAVWAGGQLTLVGLVGVLRTASPDAPRLAAQRFNRIAWVAFGIAVATGIWNLVAAGHADGEFAVTVAAKLAVVGLSGVSAALHSASSSTPARAAWGAVSLLTALLAVYLGVLLRG